MYFGTDKIYVIKLQELMNDFHFFLKNQTRNDEWGLISLVILMSNVTLLQLISTTKERIPTST